MAYTLDGELWEGIELAAALNKIEAHEALEQAISEYLERALDNATSSAIETYRRPPGKVVGHVQFTWAAPRKSLVERLREVLRG